MANQISYVHGSSRTSLIGETIGANLDRIAATYPERDAVVVCHQDARWTYAEFADRVERLARGLIVSGLQPGDRMGIWSPNCAEWLLVQYASAKAGVVLVNVNPAYRTSELEYVLNQSGCRMLVSAGAFKSSDYAGMVDEVAPRCLELDRVVFLDSSDWEQLSAGEEDVSLPSGLQCDEPINIQYTSGTTGFPKGATLTHHNILNNGFFIGEACRYTPRTGCASPYRSITVSGWCSATSPARLTVHASSYRPRRSTRLPRLPPSSSERCTSLYGVPTMFIAELELPEFEGLRSRVAADRHHGRLPVPDRGDAQGDGPDAHGAR